MCPPYGDLKIRMGPICVCLMFSGDGCADYVKKIGSELEVSARMCKSILWTSGLSQQIYTPCLQLVSELNHVKITRIACTGSTVSDVAVSASVRYIMLYALCNQYNHQRFAAGCFDSKSLSQDRIIGPANQRIYPWICDAGLDPHLVLVQRLLSPVEHPTKLHRWLWPLQLSVDCFIRYTLLSLKTEFRISWSLALITQHVGLNSETCSCAHRFAHARHNVDSCGSVIPNSGCIKCAEEGRSTVYVYLCLEYIIPE